MSKDDPSGINRDPAQSVNDKPRVHTGRQTAPTSGDKPVDNVDNSVTRGQRGPTDGAKTTSPSETGDTFAGSDHSALKGSDLAKAALAAARTAAQERGRNQPKRRFTSGAGAGDRRRRRWSSAGADERDPQPIGRLVSRIARERKWTDQLAGGSVFSRWPQLVGADVAEHAKPLSLKDGELTVQASSTAWATQLRLLQRQLLVMIAKGVGPNVVKRLRVQGPAAPSWRHGPRHVSGRGPRDTYG